MNSLILEYLISSSDILVKYITLLSFPFIKFFSGISKFSSSDFTFFNSSSKRIVSFTKFLIILLILFYLSS